SFIFASHARAFLSVMPFWARQRRMEREIRYQMEIIEKGKTDKLKSEQKVMIKEYQQTLKGEVCISGVGLHTGKEVTLTMKPANPGFGIRFQRTDLPDQPIVKA